MTWLWREHGSPKDIPQWAHTYLVVTLGEDTDALSDLKCVERVSIEDGAPVDLLRVYRPDAARGAVRVTDFTSLDAHPEAILFEGYRNRVTGEVRLVRKE